MVWFQSDVHTPVSGVFFNARKKKESGNLAMWRHFLFFRNVPFDCFE